MNITGIPEKCQLSWKGLSWFSMEMKIATGWRQELEPFPVRSEPLPTPSSLLESLGLSPMCKMTVRGEGKGIFLLKRTAEFEFPCHGIREKSKICWKETSIPFDSSLAALNASQNSNSYIPTDFTPRKDNVELLLLPFLTSPPSFAPSLPCHGHLWSPCSSLLIYLCHYPSYPSASSSCLQHCSPLSQELWIYPAKAQGNNCLYAAQAFEIPGENEISLACFRSWGFSPSAGFISKFPVLLLSCQTQAGSCQWHSFREGTGSLALPPPSAQEIQLLIQLSLFLSRAKPSWGNLTFQLQRNQIQH